MATTAFDGMNDAERPSTFWVRMTIDMEGPNAACLERLAADMGKPKAEVVRLGLDYVFKALRERGLAGAKGAWAGGV